MNARRVLYVSHNPSFQGAVLSLYTLVRALDRKRYTPLAAFSKDGPMVERLISDGVDAYVLDRRGPMKSGLVMSARSLVKREGVEIVHLNNAVPFNKYVAMGAKLAGARVAWHVREPTTDKKMKRIGPWVRRLSDVILCVNTEQEIYFKHTGKAAKVYNGVDTDEYRPGLDGAPYRDKAGFGPDDIVFGLVGTIEPRKGTIPFLKAAERLAEDDPRARFMLVGSGLPEYEAEVGRFLDNRPGLKTKTCLTGRIQDVPSAMAAMDVLVMPSLWEGFPRSLIESMSMGIPAIASGVGEVPEIVDDAETGVIIPPGDEDELLGAMRGLLETGGEGRKRMGLAARDKALRCYNIGAHAGEVMDVYDRLCAGMI